MKLEWGKSEKTQIFSSKSLYIAETIDYKHLTMQIKGSRTWAFDCCQFRWRWMTLDADFLTRGGGSL